MVWSTPYEWQNADLVDSLDCADFIEGNVKFLRDEASSSALTSLTFSRVDAVDRSPDWRTITSFDKRTYGKDIYASIAFSVVNGFDVWPAGTIFVGADDTTDIVEKVGERITRVAVRDGYTRSAEWVNLLRQRQQLANLLDQIEAGIQTYRNVDAVFGYGAPACEYASLVDRAGHELSSRDRAGLSVVCQHLPRRSREWDSAVSRLERQKDDINNRMRAIGVLWRHRDILTPGQDRRVAESSQITRTRVTTRTETITYDKVFMRLLIDGELSRELIHDGADRTRSGEMYIPNIPAGQHRIDLQWRAPQFTGHEPQSGRLIAIANLNIQLKELRYHLLDEAE